MVDEEDDSMTRDGWLESSSPFASPRVPRSHAPWTDKEDRDLWQGWRQGMGLNDLARRHQRSRNAIRSRIRKYGFDPSSGQPLADTSGAGESNRAAHVPQAGAGNQEGDEEESKERKFGDGWEAKPRRQVSDDHPRSVANWKSGEDQDLLEGWREGRDVAELAKRHKRSPSAIIFRLNFYDEGPMADLSRDDEEEYKSRPWTEFEDHAIDELTQQGLGPEAIADRLVRQAEDVQKRINQRVQGRRKGWRKFTPRRGKESEKATEEPDDAPPPIAEKVRFWQEQDRINKELIPRVVELSNRVTTLMEKEVQLRTQIAETDARLFHRLKPEVAKAVPKTLDRRLRMIMVLAFAGLVVGAVSLALVLALYL